MSLCAVDIVEWDACVFASAPPSAGVGTRLVEPCDLGHASEFLGVSKSGINMLSMLYMILFLPGTLLASYIMSVALVGVRLRGRARRRWAGRCVA
jgi:hypothetical protein